MKKRGRSAVSLLLCAAIIMPGSGHVMAAPGQPGQDLNPLVAVIEKVEAGEELNLTEEGTLDWVHITGDQVNRKKQSTELIRWENLDPDSAMSTARDSAMGYTWTDGDAEQEKTNYTYAGVFNYRGIETGTVNKDAGYSITVPAADETRTLTFVSGIWQAKADIEIAVNDSDTPVYTTELSAGGSALMNKYTVTVRKDNTVTVTTKIKEKTHKDGNLSLGGIALKTAEPSPISVKVKDAGEIRSMDLTETGDVDWVHFEGEKGFNGEGTGTTVRKSGVDPQITYKNLSADASTSMSDARIKYSWTDGTPTESATDNTTGAVFTYKNGDTASTGQEITEQAGYELKVKAADYDRELTFVSGVWNADAAISIILDGESEPVYENNELTAGGESVTKIYTVSIAAGKGVTVTGLINKKSNEWGNFNLQTAVLSENQTLNDFRALLQDKILEAKALNLADYDEFYASQLESEIRASEELIAEGGSNAEYYTALLFLTQAYESCLKAETTGSYMYETNGGLTASFGWEGDKDAPIAYIDGSYNLRDNGNKMITFGVKDIPGKIKWYNAEGYLPCFVSEYEKDGMQYKIENFANKHTIDGNDFEIAYSRMTAVNTSDEEKYLPKVSASLIPLNKNAENAVKISADEAIVREYAVGADRFGGNYAYPEDEKIAAEGGFEENYAQMREYWNNRLEPLTKLDLPDEQLVNAYKAGFIYTLIIRDDVDGSKQLHVGENGYDILFDHDTIGIVASLLTEGDFMYAKEYLATLPAQLQYDDAKWKYSWPYALYLSKTGDYEFIKEKFETIKTNTHNVETDRIDGGTGIIKKTNAIDSNGYWLIDNWAALAGLSTYQYLCGEMYEKYGGEEYTAESQWARNQYDSLLAVVEEKQKEVRENYDYPYLSIDMTVPTEDSARGDVRDANWASMFLFGRWGWDGWLFGAEQEGSEMISLIDDTYTHGFERREGVSDSIYNFGGYPHGYYCSAYNAGYGSTALRGEKYRDSGIKAYQFMIENAMSGPFGWWEGVDYQSDDSPWDISHAKGGGGSCQHMWGQSTASKVLIDSLIAEKINDKIIIGRGVPAEWVAADNGFSVSDHVVEQGKKIGYSVSTSADGRTVDITFSGDTTELPLSIELIAFKNNIDSVSGGFEYDEKTGIVTVPGGTRSVTVVLKQAYDSEEKQELEEAEKRLKAAVQEAAEKDEDDYTSESYSAVKNLVSEADELLKDESRTSETVNALAAGLEQAINSLRSIYVDYAVVDTSGGAEGSAYRFGQKSDQYMRYQTFFANHSGNLSKIQVKIAQEGGKASDLTAEFYSLQEDNLHLDKKLAFVEIPAEKAEGIVSLVFDNPPAVKEGEGYAIMLGQKIPDDDVKYVWTHVKNTDPDMRSVKVSNNNGELKYTDETDTIGTAWFRAVISNYSKANLDDMVQKTEGLDPDKYTKDSVQSLEKAVEEAKSVLADADAGKEDVENAEKVLRAALDKLTERADVSELKALTQECRELDLSLYTKESAEAFEKILEEAEALTADENLAAADQGKIDDMIQKLTDAKQNLEFIEKHTHQPADDEGQKDDSAPEKSVKTESAVQTGDQTPVSGMFLICTAAFGVIAAAVYKKRKKA